MNKIQSMGEIASWKPPSTVSLSDLRTSLVKSGLSEDYAKDLLPRNAFSRAAKKLLDGRVIDKVNETDDELVFQFTQTFLRRESHEMQYSKECFLYLNKVTGDIECAVPSIRLLAMIELQRAMDNRTSNDVTRIIQNVFQKHNGELIQIRDQGGVYFVPSHLEGVLDQVDNFLSSIGGNLKRFKITPDGGKTDASVASSINDHFQGMLSQLREHCQLITSDTSDTVKAKRWNEFMVLRGKLEVYSDLLQDFSREIADGIEGVEKLYNERINAEFEPEPEPTAPVEVTNAFRQRLAQWRSSSTT